MLISENNIRRLARTMLFSETSNKIFEFNLSPSNGGNGDAQGNLFSQGNQFSQDNQFSRLGVATKFDRPIISKEDVPGLDQNNVMTKTPLPTSKQDLNVYVADLLNRFVDLSRSGSEIGELAGRIEDCIKGLA